MKFSYKWLKELATFKESPEKLAEFLTLRAFEVESVATRGGDWALDIKLFPNRAADAAGHVGMAREIAALQGRKVAEGAARIREVKRRAGDLLKLKIENPVDSPRYTARVLTGVKIAPSPKWLRERLETCGIQAINNVVDAANYVMLELGQPLHVFDAEKIKGGTIVVRRAKKGETLLALDEHTYELGPEILVIADASDAVAIAGIKGGKHSGVSQGTRTIILESANFDPERIRKASQLLGLKTDASWRFERGMDPNQTAAAIDRLAILIQELAGGDILAGRMDEYPKRLRPTQIRLRSKYTNRLVGAPIPPAFIASSLTRLGWAYRKKGADFIVQPPTERRDIQIEEDIIEEIVRLWGLERIAAQPPATLLLAAAPNEKRQWEERVRDILAGSGFTEAYIYQFAGEKLLDTFAASPQGLLELENPTNPDTRYLIGHPAQQYLRLAAENLRRESEVALFGIAKGFKALAKPTPKVPAEEQKYLSIVKAGKESRDGETFYAVKGALDQLLESLGIAEHWYDDALTSAERKKSVALHPYRVAKVMAGDEFLGVVAELHPEVLERLKARPRIVFAELSFEKLWKAGRAEAEYRPVGKYPAIVRDIAVIVPANTKTEEVLNVIENTGGELLIDTDLFDYFQDEAMRERDAKSSAFHLVFQSPSRTLRDDEVNALIEKIVAVLEAKNWEVRK